MILWTVAPMVFGIFWEWFFNHASAGHPADCAIPVDVDAAALVGDSLSSHLLLTSPLHDFLEKQPFRLKPFLLIDFAFELYMSTALASKPCHWWPFWPFWIFWFWWWRIWTLPQCFRALLGEDFRKNLHACHLSISWGQVAVPPRWVDCCQLVPILLATMTVVGMIESVPQWWLTHEGKPGHWWKETHFQPTAKSTAACGDPVMINSRAATARMSARAKTDTACAMSPNNSAWNTPVRCVRAMTFLMARVASGMCRQV